MSISHTTDRAIDHMHMIAMSVGLASTGAAIGSVFRPLERSPSISLKSRACCVVKYTPALAMTDISARWPRSPGFDPVRVFSYRGIDERMR